MNLTQAQRFRGLVAAPFTPFNENLSVNLDRIPSYANLLRDNGVIAAFICGTTGEGLSLTTDERLRIAEKWMESADEKLRVIVHVGHNCMADAQRLTAHAGEIGASAIGAFAPNFFKPRDHDELADWCARISEAAPAMPFYYYHIPSMTGVNLPVAPLLSRAAEKLPSLAGVKYTHNDFDDYEACVRFAEGRYDILFGRDELLLESWSRNALGAVGSTYNYAAPLYSQLLQHLAAGKENQARALQDKAIEMISICNNVGVTHLAASKAVMAMLGVDCGPVRPPLRNPTAAELTELRRRLDAADFFSTACRAA
ncbi:MAG TPA: dihydrodipicolinate synthase family protein [Opitutus sp.]|nr:dihydrodipicolinate synthase family protein [Opitutus sp.]